MISFTCDDVLQVVLDPCLRLFRTVVLFGICWAWLEFSGWHGLPNLVVEAFGSAQFAIGRLVARIFVFEADSSCALELPFVHLALSDVAACVMPRDAGDRGGGNASAAAGAADGAAGAAGTRVLATRLRLSSDARCSVARGSSGAGGLEAR